MLRFLPLSLTLAALLWLGLGTDPVQGYFQYEDKFYHLVGFFALALTLRLAFPQMKLVWFLGLGIGTAVVIEAAQFFMVDRDASLGDMAANVAGILLGWVASRWLRGRRRRATAGEA